MGNNIKRAAILAILGLMAFTAFVTWAVSAEAQTRGYTARACGFDMDGDGIIGENTPRAEMPHGDDCSVCDGLTTDVDDDGVDEDLWYVDCTGSNGTGTAANPFNNIASAFAAADGPGDGAEDIICIYGTPANPCSPNELNIPHSGVSSTYTRTASGNEARNFEYGQDPFMVIGWDKDNDGQYPPFDTDDSAVLDGDFGGAKAKAFRQTIPRVEYAHLTVRDYGLAGSTASNTIYKGFIAFADSGHMSHTFVHDVDMFGISRGAEAENAIRLFAYQPSGGADTRYMAFENIRCDECGGYGWRGAGGNGEGDELIRIKNAEFICYAAGGAVEPFSDRSCTFFKIWGPIDQVEMIDSIMDGNINDWATVRPGFPDENKTLIMGFRVGACGQQMDVVNNEFWDVNSAVTTECVDGACTLRSIDEINIRRNKVVYRSTFEQYNTEFSIQEVAFPSTCTSAQTIEDMRYENNSVYSPNPLAACFQSRVSHGGSCTGGDIAGQIVYYNNTCHADIATVSTSGAWCIQANLFNNNLQCDNIASPPACQQSDYILKGNIADGLGAGDIAFLLNAAGDLDTGGADYNATPTSSNCRTGTSTVDCGVWPEGGANDVDDCDPSYSAPLEHLHLLNDVQCVSNVGPTTPFVTQDIDGQNRASLGANDDLGADALASGATTTTTTTTNTTTTTTTTTTIPVTAIDFIWDGDGELAGTPALEFNAGVENLANNSDTGPPNWIARSSFAMQGTQSFRLDAGLDTTGQYFSRDDVDIEPTGPFTIGASICPTGGANGNNDVFYITENDPGFDEGFVFYVDFDCDAAPDGAADGCVVFGVHDESDIQTVQTPVGSVETQTDCSSPPTNWYVVMGRHDPDVAGGLQVWVWDSTTGEVQGTTGFQGTPNPSVSSPLRLGDSDPGFDFAGHMDGVFMEMTAMHIRGMRQAVVCQTPGTECSCRPAPTSEYNRCDDNTDCGGTAICNTSAAARAIANCTADGVSAGQAGCCMGYYDDFMMTAELGPCIETSSVFDSGATTTTTTTTTTTSTTTTTTSTTTTTTLGSCGLTTPLCQLGDTCPAGQTCIQVDAGCGCVLRGPTLQ